jgi:hypothetical protein
LEEVLGELNTIKVESSEMNNEALQNKITLKKQELEGNIIEFFNKFQLENKLIFAKLKDTINNEENTLIASLDELKERVNLYMTEEELMNNQNYKGAEYPESDINFRKNTVYTKESSKKKK